MSYSELSAAFASAVGDVVVRCYYDGDRYSDCVFGELGEFDDFLGFEADFYDRFEVVG